MSQKFYVQRAGEVSGPFSFGEILRQYSHGEIEDATLVWDRDCGRWLTLGRLREVLMVSVQVIQKQRTMFEPEDYEADSPGMLSLAGSGSGWRWREGKSTPRTEMLSRLQSSVKRCKSA
jgi:hypothetical protein